MEPSITMYFVVIFEIVWLRDLRTRDQETLKTMASLTYEAVNPDV